MDEDKKSGYIRGCVVKQGNLGQYYLKQGENKSAERVFLSALGFIRRKDEALFNEDWNPTETSAAEQIALSNVALLHVAEKNFQAAESAYLEAMILPASIHTSTATKILTALRSMYIDHKRPLHAEQVEALAKEFNFNLVGVGGAGTKGGGYARPKRVVFCVDYSGSMSGAKIRAAIQNVESVFKDHIHINDAMMLIHFTAQVITDFGLMLKTKESEGFMLRAIQALNSPTGTTAFFDSVVTGLDALAPGGSSNSNDWIIALTDGEDNGSHITHSALIKRLKASGKANLIVIGVGSDVKTDELKALATATEKGVYLFADGNKDSIDLAFGQVALLIQGQLILEEM